MKTPLIYLLFAVGMLMGFATCAKPPMSEIQPKQTDREMLVSLVVQCPDMEKTQSKALTPSQEKTVHDLNIYVFNQTVSDIVKHVYTTTHTDRVLLNLVRGKYDFYVIANAGRDLGGKSKTEVENDAVPIASENDLIRNSVLVMTARQMVSVAGAVQVPVLLTRAVAKVDVSLSVAPAVSEQISIQSVQVIGVPKSMSFFALNRPTSRAEMFDYPKQNIVANALSYSFYMPENAQGVNARITDQRQKNRANSPVAATYLHIQGTSTGGKVDYFVYLGENNTSDFNTYRNKQYIVQAVIKGVNDIDTRVSTTEMTVAPFAPTYAPGEMAHSQLTVKCTNNAENLFYLSYSVLSGSGSLQIDGVNRTPNTPFLFLSGGSQKTAAIAYTQDTPGAAEIRFDLTDKYGFCLQKSVSTVFVAQNPIIAGVSNFVNTACHTSQYFSLTLSENNYAGPFGVTCELVKGAGRLAYNTAANEIASGTKLSLPSGTHGFYYTGSQIGETVIRFTVTDTNGQRKTVEQTVQMTPLTINVTPIITWGTQNFVVGNNDLRKDSYVNFEIKTSQNPLHTLSIEYKIGYFMTNTMNPPTTQSKPSQTFTCTLTPERPSFWTRAIYNTAEGPHYAQDGYGNPSYLFQHGYVITSIASSSVNILNRPSDLSVSYYFYAQQIINVNK